MDQAWKEEPSPAASHPWALFPAPPPLSLLNSNKSHRPIYKMGQNFFAKSLCGLGLFAWVASEPCQGAHFEELRPSLHISRDHSLQLWLVSTNCFSSKLRPRSLAPAPPFCLALLMFPLHGFSGPVNTSCKQQSDLLLSHRLLFLLLLFPVPF